MKLSSSHIAVALAALLPFAFAGCNRASKPERPATVPAEAKEKHTKSKAHAREKKKEKAEGKKAPKTAPPTPAPDAKPAQ